MAEIWYLKVSTWVGTLGYAKHYYGRLQRQQPRSVGKCPECRWGGCHSPSCSTYLKDIEVWADMTAEQAAETNEDDGSSTYSAGDPTMRFSSMEDLERAAIATWMAAPGRQEGDILVEGDLGVVEPRRPIAGLPEALERIQELWERFLPTHGKTEREWTDADSDALHAFGAEWWSLEESLTGQSDPG